MHPPLHDNTRGTAVLELVYPVSRKVVFDPVACVVLTGGTTTVAQVQGSILARPAILTACCSDDVTTDAKPPVTYGITLIPRPLLTLHGCGTLRDTGSSAHRRPRKSVTGGRGSCSTTDHVLRSSATGIPSSAVAARILEAAAIRRDHASVSAVLTAYLPAAAAEAETLSAALPTPTIASNLPQSDATLECTSVSPKAEFTPGMRGQKRGITPGRRSSFEFRLPQHKSNGSRGDVYGAILAADMARKSHAD